MSDNPDNLDELNKWFIIWPTKKVLNVTVSGRFLTISQKMCQLQFPANE